MRLALLNLLLLIAIVIAIGSISVTAQSSTETKAVIYVYSFNVSALGTVRKTVYLDGKPLADVTPGRYFVAVIDPGEHELRWKEKNRGGILKEFMAGQVYYLRAGWNEGGMMIKTAGLDLVAPENGSFDIKQLRPVEAKNIKDKDRAMPKLPTSSEPSLKNLSTFCPPVPFNMLSL